MSNFIKHFLSSVIVISLVGCISNKSCVQEKIIPKTDFTKPFFIKNKYCIESIIKIKQDDSEVSLKIIDQVSGMPLEGVIFFTNSSKTIKVKFSNGIVKKKLIPGKYIIEVSATGKYSDYSIPFSTKEIKVPPASKIKINCFIGGVLEF